MRESSAALLQATLDHVPFPIFVVSDESEILEANQEACRSLDFTKDELLTMSLDDLAPSSETSSLEEVFSKDNNAEIQQMVCNKHGETLLVDASTSKNALPGLHVVTWTSVAKVHQGQMLSHREQEVVSMFALGESTKSIAQKLGVSPKTVSSVARLAALKLGARTRAQATVRAALSGQIDSSLKPYL